MAKPKVEPEYSESFDTMTVEQLAEIAWMAAQRIRRTKGAARKLQVIRLGNAHAAIRDRVILQLKPTRPAPPPPPAEEDGYGSSCAWPGCEWECREEPWPTRDEAMAEYYAHQRTHDVDRAGRRKQQRNGVQTADAIG